MPILTLRSFVHRSCNYISSSQVRFKMLFGVALLFLGAVAANPGLSCHYLYPVEVLTVCRSHTQGRWWLYSHSDYFK